MNIEALRALFPVTGKSVFLNNAAESPLNVRSRQRLEEYLTLASDAPQDKPSVREGVRVALCGLFGGTPADYALVTSTGAGIGMMASGYDWKPGDNVVVPADEHWNNTFPWLALRERGVDVRLVPVGEDQRVTPQSVAALVDEKTRILATAAVRFNTGFRADLGLLSEIAHKHQALFLVDGIQAAGVTPLNVDEDGIDILACAGFKWLLGMHGTGFLYANAKARERIRPVMPGMFAAQDNTRELHYFPEARRFETGTLAYSLFHAWTAGLEIVKEIGVAAIHARVLGLTDRIIGGLRAQGLAVVSPVETVGERSAIISFTRGSAAANRALYDQLMSQGMIVALRDGRIRVSPNFFNTDDEIDEMLQALQQPSLEKAGG
ncbi:MAG: aminotransferase class V-fold PLP-dependent enzyme [Vicinamibacteria bacterium]